jgi:phosphoribosylformylglycinamidine synthase
VVLRYANADGSPAGGVFPANPNGSLGDIAGICDPTGRVFGLMPHPEAYNHWTNHPEAFHRSPDIRETEASTVLMPGVKVLRNAVEYLI